MSVDQRSRDREADAVQPSVADPKSKADTKKMVGEADVAEKEEEGVHFL